jgi:hypothetical protein
VSEKGGCTATLRYNVGGDGGEEEASTEEESEEGSLTHARLQRGENNRSARQTTIRKTIAIKTRLSLTFLPFLWCVHLLGGGGGSVYVGGKSCTRVCMA